MAQQMHPAMDAPPAVPQGPGGGRGATPVPYRGRAQGMGHIMSCFAFPQNISPYLHLPSASYPLPTIARRSIHGHMSDLDQIDIKVQLRNRLHARRL